MIDSLDKKIYSINIITISLFSFIIIILLCINLDTQKKHIIDNAKNQTQSVANLVNSDIERLLFGVEELIEGIHNTEEHISCTVIDPKVMDELLKKNLRPYIMDILVINGDGKITSWTAKGEKPNVKDRKYVKYHLDKHNTGLYVGLPQISRVHKDKWFFAISKSHYFNKEQHIITVILDLNYFNTIYSNSLINKDSTIFIAATNGQIYARYPYDYKYIGKKVKKISEFAKSDFTTINYDIPSPLDNKERIATLIKSDTYPLIVGSSVLTKDILKIWEQQRFNTVLIASILIIGFVFLIYYYTKLQKKLVLLSQTDSLTKLLNRGYFSKRANKEFSRAQRYNEEISILMLDIDNFKSVNDKYGHHEGDIVIKKMAKTITSNIRDIDLSARYGGEEFIILLVNTNMEDGFNVAKRIKDSFAKEDKITKNINTVSIGISSLQKDDKGLEDIIKRADSLLYTSKNSGKNTISK